MMHGHEKSDSAIVAGKPTNKAVPAAAEPVEPRAGARGTRASKARTGHRDGSACHKRWNAYGKPRKGRRRSSLRSSTTSASTACGWRSSPSNVDAASGVDGLTWPTYEADLERNLTDLHERVHRGAYRALPSRRYTFLNRTGGSARSRSQPLRTKSSRERPLLC